MVSILQDSNADFSSFDVLQDIEVFIKINVHIIICIIDVTINVYYMVVFNFLIFMLPLSLQNLNCYINYAQNTKISSQKF